MQNYHNLIAIVAAADSVSRGAVSAKGRGSWSDAAGSLDAIKFFPIRALSRGLSRYNQWRQGFPFGYCEIFLVHPQTSVPIQGLSEV